MEESTVVKAVATVFCVFIVTVGGCEMRRNELKYETIKSGVDPMALSCAVSVSERERDICMVIAKRGESK